jgi:hypothetical protein
MATVTPNGLVTLTYPFYVMSSTAIQSIGEWKPVSFKTPSAFEVVLFFALFVLLYRGVRVGAARLGLLLLLLYMTLQHIRQEAILVIVGPMLLAGPLARALEPGQAERHDGWPPLKQWAVPVAVVLMLFAAAGVWRLAMPVVREDRRSTPVTALEHVPAALRAKPVFNDYSFGGWLIFKGVRPFMDGRSDMYGDALTKLYLQAEGAQPAAVDSAFRRYDIQWTILEPVSALVAKLDRTPGWRRIYADKWAVVQVHDDALPPRAASTRR